MWLCDTTSKLWKKVLFLVTVYYQNLVCVKITIKLHVLYFHWISHTLLPGILCDITQSHNIIYLVYCIISGILIHPRKSDTMHLSLLRGCIKMHRQCSIFHTALPCVQVYIHARGPGQVYMHTWVLRTQNIDQILSNLVKFAHRQYSSDCRATILTVGWLPYRKVNVFVMRILRQQGSKN